MTLTLPPALEGLHVIVSLSAAQDVNVDPHTDNQIIGLTSDPNDAISSDTAIGTTVELVAIDHANWLPIRKVGTWSDVN